MRFCANATDPTADAATAIDDAAPPPASPLTAPLPPSFPPYPPPHPFRPPPHPVQPPPHPFLPPPHPFLPPPHPSLPRATGGGAIKSPPPLKVPAPSPLPPPERAPPPPDFPPKPPTGADGDHFEAAAVSSSSRQSRGGLVGTAAASLAMADADEAAAGRGDGATPLIVASLSVSTLLAAALWVRRGRRRAAAEDRDNLLLSHASQGSFSSIGGFTSPPRRDARGTGSARSPRERLGRILPPLSRPLKAEQLFEREVLTELAEQVAQPARIDGGAPPPPVPAEPRAPRVMRATAAASDTPLFEDSIS